VQAEAKRVAMTELQVAGPAGTTLAKEALQLKFENIMLQIQLAQQRLGELQKQQGEIIEQTCQAAGIPVDDCAIDPRSRPYVVYSNPKPPPPPLPAPPPRAAANPSP